MYSKKEVTQSLIYNLTPEELSNPYLLIVQFFDLNNLNDHLELLHDWKDLVLTDQHYVRRNCPADLIHQHQHLMKLLEAAWLLRKTHKVSWPSDEAKLHRTKIALKEEREKTGNFQCYLTDEELLNPYIVFRVLFKVYNLNAYRWHLRDWLNEALSNTSLTYEEVTTIYKNLQRLYQASWLVLQREVPNLLPDTNIKIDQ